MRGLIGMGVAALAIGLAGGVRAQDEECGGADTPCEIADGTYHLRVPDGWDGQSPLPVLIFYHGFRGNGRSILGSGGLETDFSDAGFLLVAPNGVVRESDGVRMYPARIGVMRDDVAFTLAVLDDVEARLPIDRTRLYASGFSAGGSMASLLACEVGDQLAGMVAVAGALREPNPTECAGLAGLRVMQVHGFTDGQVPLEGRRIRDWHQGSVWESLDRARERNGCRSNPDGIEIGDGWRRRDWDTSCSGGGEVRFLLHDGGHGLPPGWTAEARRFFEGG